MQEKLDFIELAFTYHAPRDGQADKYEQIRAKAKEFAYLIEQLCPQSAEQMLAWRNLQEAMMFANASIAMHG